MTKDQLLMKRQSMEKKNEVIIVLKAGDHAEEPAI